MALRAGSILEGSKLTAQEFIVLLYFFCKKYPVELAVEESGVSKVSVVEWFQRF